MASPSSWVIQVQLREGSLGYNDEQKRLKKSDWAPNRSGVANCNRK
jgi:hypothetical protein